VAGIPGDKVRMGAVIGAMLRSNLSARSTDPTHLAMTHGLAAALFSRKIAVSARTTLRGLTQFPRHSI
jgi:hypothetical protein